MASLNLVRISKINETPGLPYRATTFYKWRHLKKHPELFVKLGGGLFVNLDRLAKLVEAGGDK